MQSLLHELCQKSCEKISADFISENCISPRLCDSYYLVQVNIVFYKIGKKRIQNSKKREQLSFAHSAFTTIYIH